MILPNNGLFLIILAVAPVFVIISAAIPSTVISVPASIAIFTLIAISTITGVVAVSIPMIIGMGDNNSQSVLFVLPENGFL